MQFISQRLAFESDFLGHPRQPGVQAQAGLHAHQHQVGSVWKGLENLALTLTHQPPQNSVGQVDADQGRRGHKEKQLLARDLTEQGQRHVRSCRQGQRQHGLGRVVNQPGVVMAYAGIEKLHPQGRAVPVADRRRQAGQRSRQPDGRLAPLRLAGLNRQSLQALPGAGGHQPHIKACQQGGDR